MKILAIVSVHVFGPMV